MGLGTCDPQSRGDAFNVQQQDQQRPGATGKLSITYRYGWDGVSQRDVGEGCDGPLVNGTGSGNVWAIKAVNTDTVIWYAHTVGRRGQPRSFAVNPGTTRTLTANQASTAGYDNLSDVLDLTIDTTP